MHLSNFDYHLPPELIAQSAAEPRDSSRLLCLERTSWEIQDAIFSDIADKLSENDVLVVNETRVIKARLKWKIWWTGKDCEVFLHKQISDNSWDCLVYPGKKLKPGTQVIFPFSRLTPSNSTLWSREEIISEQDGFTAKIESVSEKWRIVSFSKSWTDFFDTVEEMGEVPLPPYIQNSWSPGERYQTVYHDKTKSWSVAAPTAGLHFTKNLLEKLKKKWVKIENVCLHVWLGTFANVEVENIHEHHMHSEQAYIEKDVAQRLNQYKQQWQRIVAVGTTSVRTLESFANADGYLEYGQKETDIFIYPGYEWKFVQSIITNFHLPKSTLLMLVSSFAGDENRKRAYKHAVDSEYRFFSFGDAMWIY